MKNLLVIILMLLFAAIPVSGQTQAEVININTADLKTLTKLRRIGPKYAKRIISYREVNGLFKKPEEIQKVSGIGPKTYEVNKGRITVMEAELQDNKAKPVGIETKPASIEDKPSDQG